MGRAGACLRSLCSWCRADVRIGSSAHLPSPCPWAQVPLTPRLRTWDAGVSRSSWADQLLSTGPRHSLLHMDKALGMFWMTRHPGERKEDMSVCYQGPK